MATKKITITVPEELLESIRSRVDARGVSAWITEAAARRDAMDKLGELAAGLQEEHGALTDEELRATDDWLAAIDAKHDALRAGAEVKHDSGQAA
ncbi:hypothetical protein J7E97_19220 [Streptomyces sp. ISL-66]|uniref:hypothetical protein n=1 Tax=Streptomyces sp. ISL-66 TaxID=2819186 RepID=UPI001BEAF846|nr:hypothetical protein [Streptomyces sp. ISL-66]MBT2469945.1 hypothetical protein [Streptomyces sp. ISL-66]